MGAVLFERKSKRKQNLVCPSARIPVHHGGGGAKTVILMFNVTLVYSQKGERGNFFKLQDSIGTCTL